MNIRQQIFLNKLIEAYSRVMPNCYIKTGYKSIDFLIYVGLLNEQKIIEFLENKITDCPLVEIPDIPTQSLGDLLDVMGDAFKNFADNIKQKEGKYENNHQRFK